MIAIKYIGEKEITGFFLEDPKLALKSLHDLELHSLYSTGNYLLPSDTKSIGFYENGKLIGFMTCSMFTESSVNLHLFVHSKYHGTRKNLKIINLAEKYLNDYPEILRLVVMTPESCTHISSILPKLGFSQDGKIPNVISWRQKLQSLLIYSKELKGDK